MSNNNQCASQTAGTEDKAITVRKDKVGRTHFRPTQFTSGQAARFSNIQRMVLSESLKFQSPILKFVACLVCFDGVATRSDLMAALAGNIYSWKDEECIEWSDPIGRINRRTLSSFSVSAWGSPSSKPFTVGEAIAHIESVLAEIYPSCTSSRIDRLLRDAQAWLTQVLPGPLLAHCLNLIPLTGLPGSALAREVTGLAIDPITEVKNEGVIIGLGQALDGFFSYTKKDSGSWLVGKIVTACKFKKNNKITLEKGRMLEECLSLAPLACEAGPISSILLAWVINFIESGTRGQINISPRTIAKYTGAALEILFQAIKDLDLDEISPEELESIYAGIKESVKPTIRNSVSAALDSFHHFLEEMLDFPPLKKPIYDGAAQLIPRANVIWQHEFDVINNWLDSAIFDERMVNQVRMSMAIMRTIRIRVSELFTLRLRNIRICSAGLEIEICPMRRDGKLKTNAARRAVRVTDKSAIEIIANWKNRRELEHAISTDLLFGDPHAPANGYRLGQLYVLINHLFKAGTGDPSASCHATSHGWVSDQFERALLNKQSVDINPLDELATGAGHAISQTSLLHYFHFFEKLLRHYLDNAIKSIKFTGSMVAKNSNITADLFRQRCFRSRGDLSNQEIALAIIRESRPNLLVPKVQDIYALSTPLPPGILAKSRSISFNDVLKTATDLAQGMAVSIVGSRCSKPEEYVQSVASAGCLVLEETRLLDRSATRRGHTASVADYQRFFTGGGGNLIQFSRTRQPKLAPLLSYLSGNPDSALLEAGIDAWAACIERKYISVERTSQCLGLIKLLKAAGIPNDRVVVCVSLPLQSEDALGKMHAQINSMFISLFSAPPIIDTKSARRGRPASYFVVSGVAPSEGVTLGSAATSMAGFNALMFAASIYFKIYFNSHTDARSPSNLGGRS